MENEQNETGAETQETEIFYDRRESQKIPLVSSDGIIQSRCWHHLKPLSDERYFQFEDEIEVLKIRQPRKLSEIYKPHHDLWRELFVEREGIKEKDTDVLFTEAVQSINALVYYESFPPRDAEIGELCGEEDETAMYFGAMFSGAWLGLQIGYKSDFLNNLDGFQDTQTNRRNLGLTARSSNKAKRLHAFTLPNITNAKGYAPPAENFIESVPAWHIVNATNDLFLSCLSSLNSKPVIAGGIHGR